MKSHMVRCKLVNNNFSQFTHYKKQQKEIDADNCNFAEYVNQIWSLQKSFQSRFSDYAKEEHPILPFIKPIFT